jgi:hypothetical protein
MIPLLESLTPSVRRVTIAQPQNKPSALHFALFASHVHAERCSAVPILKQTPPPLDYSQVRCHGWESEALLDSGKLYTIGPFQF